jgi:hypothetical protein
MKPGRPSALDAVRRLRRDEIAKLVGLVAAALVGVLVNVYSARHYSRWDVTRDKRYTLSEATKRTLHDLVEPVEIWVVLGQSEALRQTVAQLLVAYQAETSRLVVKFVDPDHDALALEDLKKRFRVEAGRSEDGHVVTDAAIIVARGEKHWFLDSTDLYEASEKDDVVHPREEQGITLAIRNVLGGTRAKLCFTEGHGEASVNDGSEHGLFFLKSVLEKENYEVSPVDTAKPGVTEPFVGCTVVVVAGLAGAFSPEEANRLRSYLMTGGSALVAAGPVPAKSGLEATGLDEVVAPFGVGFGKTIVVERAQDRVLPDSFGARFFAEPRQHPVTAALVKRDDRDVPRVLVQLARPLVHRADPGAAVASDLLLTSPEAFGLSLLDGAATWTKTPEKAPSDPAGPFVLAMASERPKVTPDAPHGPRLVVLGASTSLLEANFREPWALRGTALMVESAISWLATKPEIVDVPSRDPLPAGVRISEEARSEVRRYVMVFMPLAAGLLGLAIGFRRRSTEGREHVRKDTPKAPPEATKRPKKSSGKKRTTREEGSKSP